jgi:hypothetical protein
MGEFRIGRGGLLEIGDEIVDAAGDAFGVGARKIGGVRVNK